LRSIYPGIAFAGARGAAPTFAGASPPREPPGSIVAQSARLQDGIFTASVRTTRSAVVLLKATYDPRWTVTLDGQAAKPTMMAPSLVGVEVPPGQHQVRFRYKPYSHYPMLLAIGAIALLALALVDRRDAVRRRLTRLSGERRKPQAPDVGDTAPPRVRLPVKR
jgi:hypothetical protein